MSADREKIQNQLEWHLDSMHFTYSQHFAVANANRWFGRLIDVAIFSISSAVVATEITASLQEFWIVLLLLTTAGLSALHRATKPGEHETQFRDSAHAYQDLFKRGTDFLRLDLHDDDYSDQEVRERYGEILDEYLELNKQMPDASSLWYTYMKYVKGEDRLAEEITITETKREALLGGEN